LKEAETNIAISVEKRSGKEAEDRDSFEVFGRGELQLGILIENMRREGFEMSVSPPKAVLKRDEETGKLMEPAEEVLFLFSKKKKY